MTRKSPSHRHVPPLFIFASIISLIQITKSHEMIVYLAVDAYTHRGALIYTACCILYADELEWIRVFSVIG